jgi:hypothetical protein
MNRLVLATGLVLALSGCIVTPARVAVAPPEVVVPAGVVYVAPTYAVPAPGYVWVHHPRYGWGYHHRHHGWHRGWR